MFGNPRRRPPLECSSALWLPFAFFHFDPSFQCPASLHAAVEMHGHRHVRRNLLFFLFFYCFFFHFQDLILAVTPRPVRYFKLLMGTSVGMVQAGPLSDRLRYSCAVPDVKHETCDGVVFSTAQCSVTWFVAAQARVSSLPTCCKWMFAQKNGCKITPCSVFPLFFYALIEVGFILKLLAQVMELPCMPCKEIAVLGLVCRGLPCCCGYGCFSLP